MGHHHNHRNKAGPLSSPVAVVLLFLAVSAFPLICSGSSEASPSTAAGADTSAVHSGGHNNHHYQHHRRRHQHPRAEEHNHHQHQQDAAPAPAAEQSEDIVGEVATAPAKVLLGYADTFITKKAALQLKEQLSHMKQPVPEDVYNEMLAKLVTKPKADPKHPTFSKVYYDYESETKERLQKEQQERQQQQQKQQGLTAASSSSSVRGSDSGDAAGAADTSDRVIDLTEKAKKVLRKKHHFKAHHKEEKEADAGEQQHQGERRAKRSVEGGEKHHIARRQTGGGWQQQQQPQQQTQRQRTSRRYESQRTFVVHPSQLDHDFDDHHLQQQQQQQSSRQQHYSSRYHSQYVSPAWSNRFYTPPQYVVPGPSNYYLPVATPPEYTQFIVRPPYQPWMSFPVPGVNYNPAFPPQNPPPGVIGLRPPVTTTTVHRPHRPDTNSITEEDENTNNNSNNNNNEGNDNIPSRFGADGLDDDRFIFDIEDRRTTTQRPPIRTFTTARPPSRFTTRRPPPPLIRDSDNADDTEAAINSIFGGNNQFNSNVNVNQQQQPRTTTRRPPPPLIRNTEDADTAFGQSTNSFGSSTTGSRPQFTSPPRAPPTNTPTTRRPPVTRPPTTPVPQQQQRDEDPSRCVWAIVNCCQPQNRQVRYSCFERFGCGGAFWDINPCNEDVFDMAVDAADKFVEE